MRHFYLPVAGSLAIILLAPVAIAEDRSDTGRALDLFAEGRRLMAAGDYASACPKLAESQELDPMPDTAFDLGICYQMASQAAFNAAHKLAGTPAQTAATAPLGHASEAVSDASPQGQTQRVAGLTIGGVGVAGIVAGVVTAFMANTEYNRAKASCPSNECADAPLVSQARSAQGLATASTISFVAGAVAVGAGAIVFFTAPRSKPGGAGTISLAPATEGTGLSVAGLF